MEVVTETSFISCCRKTHNFSQSLPLVDHDPIRPKYPVLVGYRWVAETKQDWSKWSQSSELKFSLQLTRRRIKSHGKNFGDLKLRLWSGCTLVPLPSSASRSPLSLCLSLSYTRTHTHSLSLTLVRRVIAVMNQKKERAPPKRKLPFARWQGW